jgi:DNA-binding transcriptional regulator YhcF (GntR family)
MLIKKGLIFMTLAENKVKIVDSETGEILKESTAQNTVNMIDFSERLKNQEKKENSSPFTKWTQLNNEHTKDLMTLAVKYPRAHAVLYFLVDQMDNQNAIIVSINALSELMQVSRQTISNSIKILKDTNFIDVHKSGSSNVYSVNNSVFWKSHQKNRKYAKFSANVIISSEEQDKDIKQKITKTKTIELKNKD